MGQPVATPAQSCADELHSELASLRSMASTLREDAAGKMARYIDPGAACCEEKATTQPDRPRPDYFVSTMDDIRTIRACLTDIHILIMNSEL